MKHLKPKTQLKLLKPKNKGPDSNPTQITKAQNSNELIKTQVPN